MGMFKNVLEQSKQLSDYYTIELKQLPDGSYQHIFRLKEDKMPDLDETVVDPDATQPLKDTEKPPVVAPPEETIVDPVAQDISAYAALLSNILNNPEVIAEKLKNYIATKYPKRIATAYWITMKTHDQDKGLDFEIKRLPFNVQLSALMGAHSFGIGLEKEVYATGNARWSIGVAAIANYHDIKNWEPAGFLSVRF